MEKHDSQKNECRSFDDDPYLWLVPKTKKNKKITGLRWKCARQVPARTHRTKKRAKTPKKCKRQHVIAAGGSGE